MAGPTFDRIAADAAGGPPQPPADEEKSTSSRESDAGGTTSSSAPSVDRKRLPPYDGFYEHVRERADIDVQEASAVAGLVSSAVRLGGII